MGLKELFFGQPARPIQKADKPPSVEEIEALKKATKLKDDLADAMEADNKVEQRLFNARRDRQAAVKGLLEQ